MSLAKLRQSRDDYKAAHDAAWASMPEALILTSNMDAPPTFRFVVHFNGLFLHIEGDHPSGNQKLNIEDAVRLRDWLQEALS